MRIFRSGLLSIYLRHLCYTYYFYLSNTSVQIKDFYETPSRQFYLLFKTKLQNQIAELRIELRIFNENYFTLRVYVRGSLTGGGQN